MGGRQATRDEKLRPMVGLSWGGGRWGETPNAPPPPLEPLLLPPLLPLLLTPSSQPFATSRQQNLIGACPPSPPPQSSHRPCQSCIIVCRASSTRVPTRFFFKKILAGTHSPKNTNIWWCDGKTTHRFQGQNWALPISRFRAPLNADEFITKFGKIVGG